MSVAKSKVLKKPLKFSASSGDFLLAGRSESYSRARFESLCLNDAVEELRLVQKKYQVLINEAESEKQLCISHKGGYG